MNILESYEKNGYYLARSVFDKSFCKKLLNYLDTLESKVTLPFTNIPWGYGNVLNKGLFRKVTNNKLISNFCRDKFGDFVFNHLFVHNKSPWIGASIEWHQEAFNINSYAPGYSRDEWSDFAQIYVALEKQDLENGCIKLFPGSHKEGHLPSENVVNEHFSHKRRVPFKTLQYLNKKYGVKNCELEPGDVLMFNHLVVHGSASNGSSKSRKAIVAQARKNVREKNMEIFEKETCFRTNFVVDSLEARINKLKAKNIYSDMNQEDKK
jgi:ectoine hydroxylase-related dioxygenase (phytanoyl-CoA dioxygenase family)